MELIMNDFKIAVNNKDEWNLKDIAEQTSFEYNELLEFFKKKKFITHEELDNLFRRCEDDKDIQIFEKKFILYKQNPWITNAALLIKENNSDLEINEVFIQLWNALDGKTKEVYVSKELLKFLRFLNQDNNNPELIEEARSRFIEFLNDNNLQFKEKKSATTKKIYLSISKFEKCTKNIRDNEIREYYLELVNIHKSYKMKELQEQNKEMSLQSQAVLQKLQTEKAKNNNNQKVIQRMSNILKTAKNIKIKDGLIYIVTSNILAKKIKMKVGKLLNTKECLRADGDELLNKLNINATTSDEKFYYIFHGHVYNVRDCYNALLNAIEEFKDENNGDFYNIHHSYLKPYVERFLKRFNQSYDDINHLVKKPSFYTKNGTIPKRIPIPDYNECKEDVVLNHFYKVLESYIIKETLTKTRCDLFTDVLKEMNSTFDKREMWNVFKNNFYWKNSKEPITHKGHQIYIEY